MNIHEILEKAVSVEASDVHVRVGNRPVFRIKSVLVPQEEFPVLTPSDVQSFFEGVSNESQQEQFLKELELDFAYAIPGLSRFRCNASLERGNISLAFRTVCTTIPDLDQLGLPDICKDLAMKRDGLIIVTGPTGSGKSTTLASMMDYVNARIKRNIITIEDPIEYLHTDKKCMFAQRELGADTHSFASALKHSLRQDPDMILVGEMRDLETMSTALTAAETGHLVLTTLHTPSTYQAIDRFVDVFPAHQHEQVRVQLSTTLLAVLYQVLIPRIDGTGVVPAVEVMIGTPAIKNLIREGKTYQIPNSMQAGLQAGMQTIDQALLVLYRGGIISYDDYIYNATEPEETYQTNPRGR